jgi:cytochrome c2
MVSLGALGFVVASDMPLEVEAHSKSVTLSQKERGQALFVAKGCLICHQHAAIDLTPNIRTDFGGSITTLSVTPAYLRLWLKDPTALKPNTEMPNLHLSENEIEALIAFLTEAPDEAAQTETCPVTLPIKDQPPDDPNADPFGYAYWYINADRTIWAGPRPNAQGWQTGGEKVLWIRPQGTDLVISGRRLDGAAPPLQADIPCCYPTGFQATGLTFPTAGCWEVTAQAGEHTLRFVTEVGPVIKDN